MFPIPYLVDIVRIVTDKVLYRVEPVSHIVDTLLLSEHNVGGVIRNLVEVPGQHFFQTLTNLLEEFVEGIDGVATREVCLGEVVVIPGVTVVVEQRACWGDKEVFCLRKAVTNVHMEITFVTVLCFHIGTGILTRALKLGVQR